MSILRSIKPAFWLANAQEACERLAYFGIRAVLPLMMVSVGTGGLGLSMAQKGAIYGLWAFIQCIVPMVSGGFCESFGYKKSLIVAFCINTLGYLLMANVLNVASFITGSEMLDVTANFWIMMVAGCTIGLGTAIFKPPVQGIVARSLTKKTSGFGFGLFYWVVNIGGFLAPMIATSLRGNDTNPTWSYVFYGAAIVTLFNLVVTFLFFKEPEKTALVEENDDEETSENKEALAEASELKTEFAAEDSDNNEFAAEDSDNNKFAAEDSDNKDKTSDKAPEKKSAVRVLIDTLKILWNDKNILVFLLIVSGFWLMFMQLWDLLPNFLNEWTDRRAVGEFLLSIPGIGSLDWFESNGALKPEMIINIDSAAIILLVLPLSALFSKFKMMTSLVLGMVISVIGFILSGLTMSGGLACLAIFIFAIGEIICSPKFNEYIGMTAPADKKAIYMGYSNIPFAIGWGAGNFISGPIYDAFSSKLLIGRDWLLNHGVSKVSASNLDIPNAQQFLMKELNFTKDQLPEIIKTSGKDLDQLKEILSQNGLSLSNNCNINPEDIDSCQIAEAKDLLSQKDLSNLMDLVNQNNVTEIPLDYCNIDCVMNHVQATADVVDSFSATDILWNASTPWIVWIILGSIGVVSMAGMIVFYMKSGMSKKDAVESKQSDIIEKAIDEIDIDAIVAETISDNANNAASDKADKEA